MDQRWGQAESSRVSRIEGGQSANRSRARAAKVRAYIPDLMDQVLAEKIDPSPVLQMSIDLEGVPGGYAMDSRQKIN
jgi:hypothetical protein